MARAIIVTATVLLTIPLLVATAMTATQAPSSVSSAAVSTAAVSTAGASTAAASRASAGTPVPASRASAGKPVPASPGKAVPKSSGRASANPATQVAVHPTQDTCAPMPKPGYSTCFAVKRTDVPAHKGLFSATAGTKAPTTASGETAAANAGTAPEGYGPSDLQSAYDLPSATAGTGETVAIVDAYDDPTAESDLQVYRAQYGLPVCDSANGCFTKVNQDGGTTPPPANASWATEISLDLDMVSAICPNCDILLVEANSNSDSDLYTAENEAVTLGAKFVSNSWAGAEDPSELTADQTTFDHPGVVITAAAGDDGYGPLYPAASQYVTAVGGTTLTQDSSVPRGWTEAAWSGTGSGCSAYEPKPSWQTDTGCTNRTEVDVSADADPDTGVAVYDTTGDTGWGVWGGTSLATPVIASVYALAGDPVAGTYPSSYPYADTSALNDVTTGSNGTCTPSYLCTAGPGYDGPTGWGTPDGVAAFTTGPHGVVSGTVTDATTGDPVSGAEVTFTGSSGNTITTTTGSDGTYSATVPVDTYSEAVSAFGYVSQTDTGVTVTDGATTTESFALAEAPSVTVSGLVTDGSGQGWPLYAQVSVPGTPVTAYTNPSTGEYSITLPVNSTYTLDVDPVYPGYQQATQSVTVGTSSTTQNVSVPVDATSCSAPGYQFDYNGTTETFDGTTVPDGWSVVNSPTSTGGWEFDDPGGLGNLTGGSGGFAEAYSDQPGDDLDTALVSPVEDFSDDATPYVQFDSDLFGWFGDTEDVDVSIDGGQTWTTVWQSLGYPGTGVTDTAIPLPMAANQSDVQVRFVYESDFGFWWELDNIFLGNRACDPIPGGLVDGVVKDGNTKEGINGATVTSFSTPAATATTGPADPSIGNGFYYLFVPGSGSQQFTAAKAAYTSKTKSVTVVANSEVTGNFTLQAGQLTVTPASVSKTMVMGNSKTENLTFTDTGKEPVNVNLYEESGSFTLQDESPSVKAAPLDLVGGTYSPLSEEVIAKTDPAALKDLRPGGGQPADAPWTAIANYPSGIMDNGAATDTTTGDVYSAGGVNTDLETSNAAYVYDPTTEAWTALPSMPTATEAPVAAFINGELYVVGGWSDTGEPTGALQIYDPTTQTWSTGTSEPTALAGSGLAVLNGEMYVIGGCDAASCGYDTVQVYNPATDSWSSGGDYPTPISWEGCGAITGDIYCAGGDPTSDSDTSAAYEYNPTTQTWSSLPPIPIDLWAMGYTAANGELLLSGGVTDGFSTITNQGYAYDPSSQTWTALPNANASLYRGGSACGFYRVGGSDLGFDPQDTVEQLPGYTSCGITDVPWLSEGTDTFTLAAGASTTVTVTLNAGDASVTQPGTYTASLAVTDDTPYSTPAVGVTMIATPPSTWGKIMGTVSGTSCSGTTAPIAGATVQIDSWANSYTLITDSSGDYALWLDYRNNPLTVIVADNTWQPVTNTVKIKKGAITTENYTLKPDSC